MNSPPIAPPAPEPRAIVNIATLTGAIVGALDDQYAGLFARDEKLAAALLAAGTASGEELWRMPLHKNYAEKLKSDIADIRNIKSVKMTVKRGRVYDHKDYVPVTKEELAPR